MKVPLSLILTLLAVTPAASGKSELETLRAKCSEQERQIRHLEEENLKLRGIDPKRGGSPAPVAAPAAATTLISNTTVAAPKAPAAESSGSYTVKAGDSFAKIARKTGTSPEALAKTNKLKITSVIRPGQTLKVPGTAASASTKPEVAPVAAKGETHRVQSGETFFNIAKKHGMTTESLVAANPGVKPSELRAGQLIHLRRTAATPTPTATTAPVTTGRAPAPTAPAPTVTKNEISPATPPSPTPAAQAPTPEKKPAIHSVTIDGEMTYGQFASKHGTSPERLNELNGLDLSMATVLAKGSELYVPAQP